MFVKNISMNLTKYVGDLSLGGGLLERLKERVFLKTQLDVVYTDFTNWERGGLISIGDDLEKGKWKHLSYTEYVWVKIVEELRNYGFSYSEILELKSKLLAFLPAQEVLQSTLDSKVELDKINPDIYKTIYANRNKPDVIKLFENKYTRLDDFLINAITYNEQSSILFFKDTYGEFSFLSKKMIELSEKKDLLEHWTSHLKRTYLSVSLNKIISKFIKTDEIGFPLEKSALLNKDEYALLKIIRNKPANIKQIVVKFKEQEIDLLEIETIKKKVDIESRLMDHIKRREYTSMKITGQDGKVTYFYKIEK